MKGTVESLKRKSEKLKKELAMIDDEISKRGNALSNGTVFRCAFSAKGKTKGTYRVYIYTPYIDETGKTKAGLISLGTTKSQEAVEFTMKVLKNVENPKTLSKVLDIVTKIERDKEVGGQS